MAGAVLAGAGLAVAPTAANAQASVVAVACTVPALRNAITQANAVQARTLLLARNCSYDISDVVPGGLRGPNGLPIITGHITMISRNTTIRRSGGVPFRLLEVAAGAVLNIRNLTLTGGDAGGNPGGAILNGRGSVLLFHSLVAGNTADNGAGLANDSGALRLVSSTVRNNTTGTGGGGGGIYTDGFLSVRFSRINSNRANTNGGGIFSELGGRTFIFRSDVVGNLAVGSGGGIFNGSGGRVQGDLVRVSFNGAINGGGVDNTGNPPGSVSFTRSAVAQNNPNNCVPLGTVPGCTG
ncbi:MAG: hypothetical protein JWO67_286 [Streptosporangiaceae bacterium]|nr:hypothetical protein [Streptosporangiaceae bacterium]